MKFMGRIIFSISIVCLIIGLSFVQAAGLELLLNPGFENGVTGWRAAGGGYISVGTAFAHSGSQGSKLSNRTSSQSGVTQDVKSVLIANGQGNYILKAWVKLLSGTDSVKVGIRITDGAGTKYLYFTSANLNTNSWTQCAGNLNISWTGTMTSAYFYVSTTAAIVDFAMDDCSLMSDAYFSATPLTDLGSGSYKGYIGGLYPGGANQPPSNYSQIGLNYAQTVQPLDGNGLPNTNGKIVLLSVGMSNTTQEYSYFKSIADPDPQKNPKLVIVDGAQGGQDAEIIKDPAAPFWSNIDTRLTAASVNANQVQAVWLKEAIAGEKNQFPTDSLNLRSDLELIISIIKQRYPNVKLCYLSSRTYGGYATTTLNPEPFAYESGFAVKWLIDAHINSPDAGNAPWLAWGPYLWTNGTQGRSDGLVWTIDDVRADDGTHPSASGQQKVANLLLNFFKSNSTTKGWFLAN